MSLKFRDIDKLFRIHSIKNNEEYLEMLICSFYINLLNRKLIKNESDKDLEEYASKVLSMNPEFDQNCLSIYTIEHLRNVLMSYISNPDDTHKRFSQYTNSLLNELIIKLLDNNSPDSTICEIGSGYGNFLIEANNHNYKSVVGLECDKKSYCLSRMVDKIINDDSNISIENKNVLIDEMRTFNYGFSFPTDIVDSNSDYVDLGCKEWDIIDKLTKYTTDRSICIVRPKVLNNHIDCKQRENVINNGYLEGIIKLPEGSIGLTNMSFYLLVFSKNNTKVKLLDLSTELFTGYDESVMYRDRPINLNVNSILEKYQNAPLYNNSDIVNEAIWELPLLINKIDNVANDCVVLSDKADIIQCTPYTLKNFEPFVEGDSEYKLLSSGDVGDYDIYWDELKGVNTLPSIRKNFLQEGDIVLTTRGKEIKCIVIDELKNDKVLPIGSLIIIRPHDKILTWPLYVNIVSPYGQDQIKANQRNALFQKKDIEFLKLELSDNYDDYIKIKNLLLPEIKELRNINKEYRRLKIELEKIYAQKLN